MHHGIQKNGQAEGRIEASFLCSMTIEQTVAVTSNNQRLHQTTLKQKGR